MSTKLKPAATEKKSGRDLATFAQLPKNTKDLLNLKEQAEKTTGPAQVAITKQIEDKDRKA